MSTQDDAIGVTTQVTDIAAVLTTDEQIARRRFVKRSAANRRKVQAIATVDDVPYGVAAANTTGNGDEDVSIVRKGVMLVEAGAAFNPDDFLKVDALGKLVPFTPAAGLVHCAGQAVEGASGDGDFAMVHVNPTLVAQEGGGSVLNMGVKADAVISSGNYVGIDRATGYVRRLSAGDLFAGVANAAVDATGQSNGALTVGVSTVGDFNRALSAAAITDLGKPVFATDHTTATFAGGGSASYIGEMVALVSSGNIVLRIRPFELAQAVRSVSVPLSSSTSAATNNPVLIAQRPLIILSAHVAFNTKPDAGNLDVGTGNSTPNELVAAFALTGLTNNTPLTLTLGGTTVAAGTRIWAKVGAASSTAGVCGQLTLRYIELP